MHKTLSVVLVVVGVAGWVGCGSDAGQSGFQCKTGAIAHGQTTQCDSVGQLDQGTPSSFSCAPAKDVSTKTLAPLGGVGGSLAGLCPLGTMAVPDSINPNKSSSGSLPSGGSSSGGSSSGGSSSGDSNVGDQGASSSSSGGSSSGGSSSGGPSDGSDTGASSSGGSSSGAPLEGGSCEAGYKCKSNGKNTSCVCTQCDEGYQAVAGACAPKGNNGVGNGIDPQPPGNPPVNDGPGTEPGSPGNK